MELRRFTAATKLYFDNPPAFLREVEARRVLLMTWLMTDPDADNAQLGLTEFEDWPWEAENDEAHIRSRRFASDWWRYPSEGYEKWRDLTRRAWATVSREHTGNGSAKPPAGRKPEHVQRTTDAAEASTDVAQETAPFAFYRYGDFWVLRFDGQGALLKHQKGLTYVAETLKYPRQKQNAEKMAQLEGYELRGIAARRYEGKDLYKTVTRAMYRARDAIYEKRELEPLWRHLDRHLFISKLTYSPDEDIDWKMFLAK